MCSSDLAWRRELRALRWTILWAWCSAAGLTALLAGLLVTGHDGRMSSYGAMLGATALVIWWRGFVRR